MPGIIGEVTVQNTPKKGVKAKEVTYKYGEISKGTQRGIKVGAKSYSLRGKGETEGKEINIHKTGAYVGKEKAFYKELAEVIASYHLDHGTYPPKGIVKVGKQNTEVIIDPA